jgi:hypothetical protein
MTKPANTVSIDLSSYATTALNGKENTLTFNASLTRTINTISMDLSAYFTTPTANSIYFRLTDATDMNGKLTINTGLIAVLAIGDYGCSGDRIILWKGGTGYPYSFGMNGNSML